MRIAMKKYILSLLAVSIAFISVTQAQAPLKSQYNLNVDTVTNTATKYLKSLAIKGIGSKGVLSVAITVTEISGTTAGKVSLEGSHDGVTFYPIYAAQHNMTDSTSFSPADVSTAQTYRFKVLDFADTYIRANYTGAGTMSAKVSGTYFYRKQND